MSLEEMIRRAFADGSIRTIMLVPVMDGFQVSARMDDSGAYKVEIQADPVDALYNALCHRDEQKRDNPIKKRQNEDLI